MEDEVESEERSNQMTLYRDQVLKETRIWWDGKRAEMHRGSTGACFPRLHDVPGGRFTSFN